MLPNQENRTADFYFTSVPVFLHRMRSVAILFHRLHVAVVKPCHGMTIGAEHCRARHVQAQSAILNRRSDCNSEYQDRPAQRIQFREQCLGVGSKNEVETSRTFFSIALR